MLFSCLGTLSLCLYTALHLNILTAPRLSEPRLANGRPIWYLWRTERPSLVETTFFNRVKRAFGIKAKPTQRKCKQAQPSFFTIFVMKTKWVLMGMFAPELVVYVAWSQWRTARKLTSVVRKHFDEKVSVKSLFLASWALNG